MKPILLTVVFILTALSLKAQTASTSMPTDTTIYDKVEMVGEYPGGPEKFKMYIRQELKRPQSLKENKIKGEVTVGFIIEDTGVLSNIHVEKSLTPDADAEALRLLKKSVRWMPGRINEKYVRQRYSVSIKF